MLGLTGNDALENLLAACAVRIEIEDLENNTTSSNGSGFFVAPGLVLTCRHVLEEADDNGETASGGTCHWQSRDGPADATFVAQLPPEGSNFEALDLALLRLTAPYPKHDCVCLMKGLSTGDNVVCFGFPGGGAGDTLTFESEGFTQKPGWRALKLKKGDAREGFSGSALLNRQTKAVCGTLYSRDLKSPETARAIPIELALRLWPEIEYQAQAYHEKHPEWSNLLPLSKFVQYIRAYRERLNRVPIALHPSIVPSPLAQKWELFLDAKAWADYIGHLLDWIKSRVDLLSSPDLICEQVAKVNLGQPYDAILAQIRELAVDRHIEEVKAVRKQLQRQLTQLLNESKTSKTNNMSVQPAILKTRDALRETAELKNGLYMLANELKSPSFQRCFLVMGGFGCGKTQFLVSLMNSTDAISIVFPMTLENAEADPPDETALKQLSQITDVEWKSLDQFVSFVFEHRKQKLLIALDDFHLALKRNPRLPRALLDAVRAHVGESLYWAVCMDEANYHLLQLAETAQQREEESQFWLEYGFTRARPRLEDFEYSRQDGTSDGEWAACGGWLSLDSLNANDQTGWKILTQLGRSSGTDTFAGQGDLPAAVQPGLLNNPWIAWTLWDIRERMKVTTLIDLNYLEFVQEFWDRYKLRIEFDVDPQYVYDTIRLLTVSVSDSNDPQLLLETLMKSLLVPQGTLPDVATARKAMNCLMGADLLRVRPSENEDFEPSHVIDLRFPFFWGWRVAERAVKELNSQAKFDKEEQERFRKRVDTLLTSDRFGLDRDSLATYLLLLLDSSATKNQRLAALADNFWSWIEKEADLRATVWLAIPKIGIPRQRATTERLSRHKPAQKDLGVREIFALIHMVREIDPQALDYGQRFHLLRPYYSLIADCGLADYFLLTVRNCLKEVNTTEEVVSAMVAFGGCEMLGRSPQLADACYVALRRLLGSPAEMIAVMISYLRAVSASEDVPERKERYFYQFTLTKFCREFIGEDGPEAFWMLRDAKWYEASRLQIRYPLDKEMKKEANFTFGFWYRTNRYVLDRKRYLNLVTELVQTGAKRQHSVSKRDREAAFFLVRHTSPTFEEHAVSVDSDFREVVKELQQDPTLAALNHKYSFLFPK